MTKPVVAIVGRPNTGKSTLLNRIVKRPVAITADIPGTTRDRNIADVTWRGIEFTLVDTGGLDIDPRSTIARGIQAQVETALRDADVIIDVVDAKDGVTPMDLEIADILRRADKPVLVCANKADNDRLETEALEFYEMGLGELLIISAHHGRGIAELLDRVVELLPSHPPANVAPEGIKMA